MESSDIKRMKELVDYIREKHW
ncbi:hypothetical protein FD717_018950 [Photobacterium damselae subsp. damselae]|nr:hypothetical protein FD717_018950 [Photobacterium damselae subsp. damselae]